MADISGLTLKAPEQIDGQYQEAGEYLPPPPEGTYVLQAPDAFEFKGDKNGTLGCKTKFKIAEGQDGAGQTIFGYLSAAKSKFRQGNTMCDYLRAHGIETVPETNQQYADLIEATAGRTFSANLVWEGYDSEADETVLKGADKFPFEKDPETGAIVVGADGQHKRSYRGISPLTKKEVLAKAVIKRFISLVSQVTA